MRNGKKKYYRKSIREVTVEKVQQWWCGSCRASFTFRRNQKRTTYSAVFIQEAVQDFVSGSSYRVIKQRKDISVGTLSAWVHEYGSTCMNPIEIAKHLKLDLHNRWSGILLLDGKYLSRNMILLLAVDYRSLDIVAWRIAENESEENYQKLIVDVQRCGYIIQALVSDGATGIRALTQKKLSPFVRKGTRTYPRPGIPPAPIISVTPFLPEVPHQWCVIHAYRECMRYVRKYANKDQQEYLQKLVPPILFASTITNAEKAKENLNTYAYMNDSLAAHRIMMILSTYWHLLTAHHTVRIKRRTIPRDTNAIENVISYLNTRLKTLRKIKTKDSAVAICNLIILNYRLKPLTDSSNKLKKNKSPLELSTKKKKQFTWSSFIKKSCR